MPSQAADQRMCENGTIVRLAMSPNGTERIWSTDPREKIANGEVIHYTRRHPETGEVTDRFAWRRTAVPQDESRSQPWSPIELRRYDASGLMAAVEETRPVT